MLLLTFVICAFAHSSAAYTPISLSCSLVYQVSQLVHQGFGGDGKYPEGLRVELLKLGALLIEFMHKELLDHRKELIKFAWNNIKVWFIDWTAVPNDNYFVGRDL